MAAQVYNIMEVQCPVDRTSGNLEHGRSSNLQKYLSSNL